MSHFRLNLSPTWLRELLIGSPRRPMGLKSFAANCFSSPFCLLYSCLKNPSLHISGCLPRSACHACSIASPARRFVAELFARYLILSDALAEASLSLLKTLNKQMLLLLQRQRGVGSSLTAGSEQRSCSEHAFGSRKCDQILML